MNQQVIHLFLRRKPLMVLLELNKPKQYKEIDYGSQIAKDTDCTYSHTVKVLNQMKEMGLVDFKMNGRIKQITLTEKGKQVANNMQEMLK